MDIRRVTTAAPVLAAGHLFDDPPVLPALTRFLASEGHHVLIAYVDDVPAGMVTGVEMTHPDKGTEMFLYELGVSSEYRGRGLGSALVTALASLARSRGCYDMWVVTEEDNDAAQATYRRAGGASTGRQVVLEWNLARPEPTP